MNTQTFTMTAEHLKLLRNFRVGWQDCEFGAPEINPKRPYGNSGDLVLKDIHWILAGERVGIMGGKRKELTNAERAHYLRLHFETETALQIVLATGRFEPGQYELEGYGINWHKVA